MDKNLENEASQTCLKLWITRQGRTYANRKPTSRKVGNLPCEGGLGLTENPWESVLDSLEERYGAGEPPEHHSGGIHTGTSQSQDQILAIVPEPGTCPENEAQQEHGHFLSLGQQTHSHHDHGCDRGDRRYDQTYQGGSRDQSGDTEPYVLEYSHAYCFHCHDRLLCIGVRISKSQ